MRRLARMAAPLLGPLATTTLFLAILLVAATTARADTTTPAPPRPGTGATAHPDKAPAAKKQRKAYAPKAEPKPIRSNDDDISIPIGRF